MEDLRVRIEYLSNIKEEWAFPRDKGEGRAEIADRFAPKERARGVGPGLETDVPLPDEEDM